MFRTHLDILYEKYNASIADFPSLSRLGGKTGLIFYVTCAILTVDGTTDVTVIAIHTW